MKKFIPLLMFVSIFATEINPNSDQKALRPQRGRTMRRGRTKRGNKSKSRNSYMLVDEVYRVRQPVAVTGVRG